MSNSSGHVIDLDNRRPSYSRADTLGINLASSFKGAARKRLYERSVANDESLRDAVRVTAERSTEHDAGQEQ